MASLLCRGKLENKVDSTDISGFALNGRLTMTRLRSFVEGRMPRSARHFLIGSRLSVYQCFPCTPWSTSFPRVLCVPWFNHIRLFRVLRGQPLFRVIRVFRGLITSVCSVCSVVNLFSACSVYSVVLLTRCALWSHSVTEQRIDECHPIKHLQVSKFLTNSDIFHRHTEFVTNCNDNSAFRGSIKLGDG